MNKTTLTICATLCVALGCTDDNTPVETDSLPTGISATEGPTGDGDPTTTGDGDPTTTGDGDPTTTGDGDPTTTGDGDPTTTATTGNDPKWDLGPQIDSNIPDLGCTKVDFLFVIDNSGSMSSHQNNLVANYPAFIQNIQDSLDSVNDYQVGIVSSDNYNYAAPGCGNNLSGLIDRTGGSNSSNQVCGPFADGGHYMTDQDDLAMQFNCAARIGTSGSALERMMDAAVETVQEPLDVPMGCNEDFLREDSLLVLLIVTDEADGQFPVPDPEGNPPSTSVGGPQNWFDAIVAERGDIETNIVPVSIINWNNGPCPPSASFYDGENIKQFTEMFTYGFLIGICEPDYGPILAQAIGVIDEACDNYISPG